VRPGQTRPGAPIPQRGSHDESRARRRSLARLRLTKKHSEVIVDTVFRSIILALQRGEKIELRGFGSFRLASGARKGGTRKPAPAWRCREARAVLSRQGSEGPHQCREARRRHQER